MAPRAPLIIHAPAASSKRKREVSEADLPPLPPQFSSNASASEKSARALIMKERRRVQMQLQEQGRAKRDRSELARETPKASAVPRSVYSLTLAASHFHR